MLVNAVRQIENGMFPIFRFDRINQNQANVGVAGTGFFVNQDGLFVTVAHIFDNTSPQVTYMYHGRLPNDFTPHPLPITEIARNDQKDIYVGRVNLPNTTFLHFSNAEVAPGRTACIAGYPLAVITANAQGGMELSGVRRYFQPSFILDMIKTALDNGHGLVRTHDGFLVRDVGLFGMSGGPVFDMNGKVLGMQAAVTNPRESTNGNRIITVENAIAIRNAEIINLLELNGIDFTIDE